MDKNKINNNKYTYLVESDDYDDKSSEGTLFIYKYRSRQTTWARAGLV